MIHTYHKATCPKCGFQFDVKDGDLNLICQECKSMIGYHEDPILRKGSVILLPKGVPYRSVKFGDILLAKRNSKKIVHHCLNGSMWWDTNPETNERVLTIANSPMVCWSGSGGYWCDADINDVQILVKK